MKRSKEEILNAITHYLGAVLSIIGFILLLAHSLKIGKTEYVISCVIFGIALIFLYTMSGTYHFLINKKLKRLFRKFDHIGIFILISASYTPYIFTILDGKIKWIVFFIQWGCTLFGTVYKLFFTGKFEILSTLLYLIMGWMIVFVIKDVKSSLSGLSFGFLVFGGITYTLGTIFYVNNHLKYNHVIWHIFVIFGSLFNYLSIYYII
ncbi:hemolysin III family protein [Fusobacterium sp.]|uniref:PAQR family membrane homeostasis protein TrhA n=1 Tax=Fusobacterium sp. TaxID=68766 RepID=UPI002610E6C7|nr:hemolysin III family protein [Fusobacterium sp.]